MNHELDKLLEQKREIERRIHEIKNCSAICGSASYNVENYSTHRPDRHYIAVSSHEVDSDGSVRLMRKTSIINGASKESLLAPLKNVIDDLTELYQRLTEEGK